MLDALAEIHTVSIKDDSWKIYPKTSLKDTITGENRSPEVSFSPYFMIENFKNLLSRKLTLAKSTWPSWLAEAHSYSIKISIKIFNTLDKNKVNLTRKSKQNDKNPFMKFCSMKRLYEKILIFEISQ